VKNLGWFRQHCVELFLRIVISKRWYCRDSISMLEEVVYLVIREQEGRSEVRSIMVKSRYDGCGWSIGSV
jgi:hypothetical protein